MDQSIVAQLDFMQIIIIVLISAGSSTLITSVFGIITIVIQYNLNKKDKLYERKEDVKSEFLECKKDIYIKALNKMLFIKRGLSITREELRRFDKLREEYNSQLQETKYIDSNLRLYASDSIFNFYENLILYYTKYSYADDCEPRLMEEEKIKFNLLITALSRMMQKDLGYRKFDSDVEMIECPKCGKKHDIIDNCPKCKLKFVDLPMEMYRKNKENQVN